jgi:hypothetical protein
MLSFLNYKLIYPNSTVTQATVEKWLNAYKRQLSGYFRFDDIAKSEFIEIYFCGQSKVFLKKPLTFDNLNPILIEEFSKKTRMLSPLNSSTDFLFKTHNVVDQEFIYALDFECMGCLCTCEMLKITGLWGVKFPEDLELEIYNLIESKSQIVIADNCQQIQSEKLGEASIQYYKNNQNINTLDINNVFSIQLINQYLSQIKTKFIYV